MINIKKDTKLYALMVEDELIGYNEDGTIKKINIGDVAYIHAKHDGVVILKWAYKNDNAPIILSDEEFEWLFKLI